MTRLTFLVRHKLKNAEFETYARAVSEHGTFPLRLWLQDELIIDESSTSQDEDLTVVALLPDKTAKGKFYMKAGSTLRLRLEYLHHGIGSGASKRKGGEGVGVRVVLAWESVGTPLQTVPPFLLYPSGERIVASPWRFNVG